MSRWVVVFTVSAVGFMAVAGLRAQASRTVWDGVYTDVQAERGGKLYDANCATCHGAEMRAGAGAPSLAGPEFSFGWDKKPLGGLFDFLKANMPPGQVGGLRDQEYADIVAAIVKRNGAPASPSTALPANKADLDGITFLADKP